MNGMELEAPVPVPRVMVETIGIVTVAVSVLLDSGAEFVIGEPSVEENGLPRLVALLKEGVKPDEGAVPAGEVELPLAVIGETRVLSEEVLLTRVAV